jgi:hypothetical protein
MSLNFIEPEESSAQQTIPFSDVLEKFNIPSENKEWLCSLLIKKEIPSEIQSDLEYFLEELVKKSNETGSSSFKALLLFYYWKLFLPYYGMLSLLSDCFDKDKLSRERINIIPELFTQKQIDKPEVFQAYVVNILAGIRDSEEKDNDFKDAYQKKLQEIRASSSFKERAVYYVKLVFQNLPKRTYKEDEKLPTKEEIDSFLDFWEDDFLNIPYSVKLIAELEGMPENELYVRYFYPGKLIPKYNISAFPFIVCGKELYTCVHGILHLFLNKTTPQQFSNDEIAQIKIPRWSENNSIHETFFIFAQQVKNLARSFNIEDISNLILDKIFEGVNAIDIPYIFFEYIEDHVNSAYSPLLKGEYSDVIEPIRTKIEYLDWALTTSTNDPHEIHFQKSRFFLDYIDKLSNSVPKDKLGLFQELFSQRRVNNHYPKIDKFLAIREKTKKDILTSIAREIIQGEWRFPDRQKEADDFVKVIAKGAVKYPVELFLSDEYRQNLLTNYPNDHELAVFNQYYNILLLENTEDALFIAKFWYKRYYKSFFGQSVSLTNHRSDLINEEAFLFKKVFLKFINDEDFICRFLSIPQNSYSTSFFTPYYLARWVLYQSKDEYNSNVFKEASEKLLHRKKIIFPDKIADFIRSYKIPNEAPRNKDDYEAKQFLFYLSAAVSEQYDGILKNFHSAEEQFPLYLIRYNYSHYEIVQQEFLDFLFSLKNPSPNHWDNKELYNLELIQEACKKSVLKKQIVLERASDYVSCYIDKNYEDLSKFSEIKRFIKYFFTETIEMASFFIKFCEQAAQENEDSYTELYIFLKIRDGFLNQIDLILKIHTDINNALITRCSKMLNNFKNNIEPKKNTEDKFTFLKYLNYMNFASNFVYEKTGNIWKALKPLILAFRASKDILLNESLNIISNNDLSYFLLNKIFYFFNIEDQEKLKELRYNMANDFTEYLKPAKNERQLEKYTQTERETEGFDLSYTEPSPYWRYAYVRALGDLGIKTDKRGHYFQKILENVSEKDPSVDVKSAAKKVMEELDAIRKGYSGANHKKCLFEAFWWLKSAHMLSLDGEIDSKKALELRIKEWR